MKLTPLQKEWLAALTSGKYEQGEPCSSDSCPIQLALCEQLGREDVRVQRTCVLIGHHSEREVIKLPKFATTFIDAFDGWNPDGEKLPGGMNAVSPIEFDLPVDHLVITKP